MHASTLATLDVTATPAKESSTKVIPYPTNTMPLWQCGPAHISARAIGLLGKTQSQHPPIVVSGPALSSMR